MEIAGDRLIGTNDAHVEFVNSLRDLMDEVTEQMQITRETWETFMSGIRDMTEQVRRSELNRTRGLPYSWLHNVNYWPRRMGERGEFPYEPTRPGAQYFTTRTR